LNPRLKLRSPIETPFRIPKSITGFISMDLDSNKLRRCAALSVQNVTMRCQLVRVVAATSKEKRKVIFFCFLMVRNPIKGFNSQLPVLNDNGKMKRNLQKNACPLNLCR
jgi:hypothetical protein